jgi:hypothetical protein
MKRFFLIGVFMLTGCARVVYLPAPVYPQIATDNVTQHDYRAGDPNSIKEIPQPVAPVANPYLEYHPYQPIESYFKPLKPSVPTTYFPPVWQGE